MYNVVFRTIVPGNYFGVITWSTYPSKEEFDSRFVSLKDMYVVVEQGVTPERAVELCSTPEASHKAFFAEIRQSLDIATRRLRSSGAED